MIADMAMAEQRTFAAAAELAAHRSRLHVLIMDDAHVDRLVFAALCDLFDYSCECVGDRMAALDAAGACAFDLVLMGAGAAETEDKESAQALCALPRAAPIIALAPRADPEIVARYRGWGVTNVIAKPVTPARLRRAISATLALEDDGAAPERPELRSAPA